VLIYTQRFRFLIHTETELRRTAISKCKGSFMKKKTAVTDSKYPWALATLIWLYQTAGSHRLTDSLSLVLSSPPVYHFASSASQPRREAAPSPSTPALVGGCQSPKMPTVDEVLAMEVFVSSPLPPSDPLLFSGFSLVYPASYHLCCDCW
jgi:hypothetical protein